MGSISFSENFLLVYITHLLLYINFVFCSFTKFIDYISAFSLNLYDILYIKSCHLQIETIFLLLFQFYCRFFPCLIVLAKTSIPILNSSGESGNPCLFLDFRGKIFSL